MLKALEAYYAKWVKRLPQEFGVTTNLHYRGALIVNLHVYKSWWNMGSCA